MIDIICHFTRKFPKTLKESQRLSNWEVILHLWLLVELASLTESSEEGSSLPFVFYLFVFASFLCCSSERDLIIVIVAIIAAVGSTFNISNWLSTFYFETRCFSSITVRQDGGNLLKTLLQSRNNWELLVIEHLLSSRTKIERGPENWALLLSKLRLGEFSIRSRRFYEIKSAGNWITFRRQKSFIIICSTTCCEN